MFKRIAIDNYRCFTNFEFAPGRINLLLGSNGAGKSSLFDAVEAVVDLVAFEMDVNEVFPSSSRTRWDKRESQRIELECEIDGGLYHYTLVIRHDVLAERSMIESEKVVRDGKTLFAFEDEQVHLHRNDGTKGVSFAFRGNRSFLASIDVREETRDLIQWRDFIRKVWSIRLDARNIESSSIGEDTTLDRNGENFASWYRHLSQENPELLEPLWGALRPAVDGFQSLKLVSSGRHGRNRDLTVVMKTSGVTYEVDFDELSDGQRALIVLYSLIQGTTPRDGCLMLDEPEAHVGLLEIQPWLVNLCDTFQTHGQVFVISHHPEVVNYMAASQPFSFTRVDGGPTRVRPADFDRESGLAPSEQIARGLSNNE
ncbi:AAA family ATPase [Nannocystaceae bacterium ST9]